MTLLQLIELAKSYAGSSSGIIKDSLYVQHINEALRQLVREGEGLEDIVEIPVTSGSFTIPIGTIRITGLDIDGKALSPKKAVSFDTVRLAYRLHPSPGVPRGYAEYGGKIFLYPVPAYACTVTVYRYKKATPLVNDGDVPEIDEDFQDALAQWAAMQAKIADEEDPSIPAQAFQAALINYRIWCQAGKVKIDAQAEYNDF